MIVEKKIKLSDESDFNLIEVINNTIHKDNFASHLPIKVFKLIRDHQNGFTPKDLKSILQHLADLELSYINQSDRKFWEEDEQYIAEKRKSNSISIFGDATIDWLVSAAQARLNDINKLQQIFFKMRLEMEKPYNE
jgi:hypothetical protein